MLLPPDGVIVEVRLFLRLPAKAQVLSGPQLVGLADPADPLQDGAVGGKAHLLRDLFQRPALAPQINDLLIQGRQSIIECLAMQTGNNFLLRVVPV